MTRRTREEWRRLCAGSFDSGMTVRAYAERHGVNANTLSWWRSQLRDELESPSFVEIATDTSSPSGGSEVTVTVGSVVIGLDSLPPAAWVAELAATC